MQPPGKERDRARRTALWLGGLLVAAALGLVVARQLLPPGGPGESETSTPRSDAAPRQLALDGAGLRVTLGVADEPGVLSVDEQPMAIAVQLASGETYGFPADFEPLDAGSHSAAAVVDAVLGPSERVRAEYRSQDGMLGVALEVTVGREEPALVYQTHLDSPVGAASPERFRLVTDAFSLAGPIDYLTLLSVGAMSGVLNDGDDPLSFPLPGGAPLLLWSDQDEAGYVLGVLDATQGRSVVELHKPTRHELAVFIETSPLAEAPLSSPRLYLEPVATRDLTAAFASFRAALDVVAPPAPLTEGFRQQWGSWYVYYAAMNEESIRGQIDTIATQYADLGPWQIVVDAGWYLSGTHPDGEMGVTDLEKFPSGMRALVDYAHERGIGVVLYGSAPWIDSHPSTGSWWMVQQGFVREHRAWLIPIQEDDDGGTYVYDLSNPQLRSYLDGLMHRYLVEFDADGILLDMVGLLTPEGGALRGDPMDLSTLPQRDLAQTMDIYRFVWETATKYKPDVWIEGAWAAPPLARPYAQTWRYADEYPAFSYPYPFGGLVEHVTFAALQEQLLGRRSHVGFIWGPDDPETLSVQRQWLAAAVAMQRQTILSTDLASVSAETTQLYREYLAALQPFSADPIFGPGTPPEVFSTTVGGTTYLGLLNTAPDARTIAVDLVEHGLSPASTALTFDPETRAVTLAEADLVASVEPRSFRLLVLRTEPGVLWADRSWWTEWEGSTLIVHVDPSPAGAGRLWVYAPGAPSIQPGSRPDVASADRGFGLVTIDLPDGAGFEVRLTF